MVKKIEDAAEILKEAGYKYKIQSDIEWLRRQAYKTVCMENRDIPKVDKIIEGIKNVKINRGNLFDEVRKFTKRVTSDHSIKRWQIITEWFANREWFS